MFAPKYAIIQFGFYNGAYENVSRSDLLHSVADRRIFTVQIVNAGIRIQ